MQKEFFITTAADAIIATVVADIAQQTIPNTGDGLQADNISIMEVNKIGAASGQETETEKALNYIERKETDITSFASDLKSKYEWKVKTRADDGTIVTIPVALPPVVDAGEDQTVDLPTTTTNLDGTVTDPNGGTPTYQWTKVSGPAGGTISSPTAVDTAITALQEGVYVFQLKATSVGGSATDTVTVTVNPEV